MMQKVISRIPIHLIFFVSFSPSIRTVVCLIKVKNINVLCVFFTAHGPDNAGVGQGGRGSRSAYRARGGSRAPRGARSIDPVDLRASVMIA